MVHHCLKFITVLIIITIFLYPVTANAASSSNTKITQDDMIYFLLTDRFYDGDTTNNKDVIKGLLSSYNGGDFQGIIDKLDYIKNLGFTAIWISPVTESDTGGYHGYWPVDYYKTNEHFGSLEKLKELVSKAHEKGIKVIVDIVLNHTGHSHPWIDNPKYATWYHEYSDIADYNNQEQVENGWLGRLPDLNQDNPEVKKYLIDMAKWWIKETGIDGYRLDGAKHVPISFWTDFSNEIKKDYPDFYLIGEVFNREVNYVKGYQDAGINGLLDFPMYYAVNDVFKDSKSAIELSNAINSADVYNNRYLMGTFIDNHDLPRFEFQLSTYKEQRLKNALTFMMTYTGIPVIYYGTEIGFDGGYDPNNREVMDWSKKSDITDYIKKLISIRKTNIALTHGDIKVLKAENDFISYSRKYENNTIIVAFNTSENNIKKVFSIPDEDKKNQTLLVDLLNSKEVKIKSGKVILDMKPLEAYVFTYKRKSNSFGKTTIFLIPVFFAIAAFILGRKLGLGDTKH